MSVKMPEPVTADEIRFGMRRIDADQRYIEVEQAEAYAQAVRNEVESLRKDAERYRWLRDPCSGAEYVIFYSRGDYGKGLMSGEMLDEAIDHARRVEGEGK